MNENRVTLIYGMTGQGKSELAKEYIAKEKRAIIFDTQEEYSGKSWNGKKLFHPIIVRNFSDFCDYIRNHYFDEEFKIVCRYESSSEYEQTISLCWNLGNVCMLLDELSLYISPTDRDTDLLKMVNFGRHRNIKIIAIARTPREFSTTLRSQGMKIVSFAQSEPIDIKALSELGLNVENLNKYEFAEKIR